MKNKLLSLLALAGIFNFTLTCHASEAPAPYTSQTSFTTISQTPITITGLPGPQMDAEFTRLGDTVNAGLARLAEIQRDDGKLNNEIVTFESLDSKLASTMIASGKLELVTWTLGGTFKKGQIVSNPAGISSMAGTYLCIEDFTGPTMLGVSGFAYEYTVMKKWVLVSAPQPNAFVHRLTLVADGVATQFTAGIGEGLVVDSAINVFVGGTYQYNVDYFLTTVNGIRTVEFYSPPAADSVVTIMVGGSSTSFVTVSDGAITTAKIADSAVTTAKVADASITAAKLAPGAIPTTTVADGSITTAKLADFSVTGNKLAANSVTTDKISDGTIGNADIAAGAITGPKIAASSVSSSHLVAGTPLTLPAAPTSAMHATTKTYVDAGVTNLTTSLNGKLNTTGGTVSGALAVSGQTTFSAATNPVVVGTAPMPKPDGSAPIYGARAFVRFTPYTGGSSTSAYKTGTVSRTASNATATVTITNHGLKAGDKIYLTSGASGCTGLFTVLTAADANTFTFTSGATTTLSAVAITEVLFTITKGMNVSSVTLGDGTGVDDFVINFVTEMPDANYVTAGSQYWYPGGNTEYIAEAWSGAETQQNTTKQCFIHATQGTSRVVNLVIYD